MSYEIMSYHICLQVKETQELIYGAKMQEVAKKQKLNVQSSQSSQNSNVLFVGGGSPLLFGDDGMFGQPGIWMDRPTGNSGFPSSDCGLWER